MRVSCVVRRWSGRRAEQGGRGARGRRVAGWSAPGRTAMAAARVERRLAAILAADVVGYSPAHGARRARHARAPQGAPPGVRRPADRRAPRPDRQADGRWRPGRVRQRRRRCRLRGRHPGGHGRARAGRAGGGAHPLPDRREPGRRDRRGRGHLRRRRQRRRPAGGAGRAGRGLRLGQGARGVAQAA